MENGNEGDEIIFLSLRQTGFSIPEKFDKIDQLNADMIVAIISRSLLLISDGEVKFPTSLPANIASRHRICTDIAAKIKELGFHGDCGYNQLLYPVVDQTRQLLTWAVESLPRSEEERVEEALGANALLSRRITSGLVEWKTSPLKLHAANATAHVQMSQYTKSFRTMSRLHKRKHLNSKQLFTSSAPGSSLIRKRPLSVESSLLERHALELLRDAAYALRLEVDFEEGADGAADASGKRGGGKVHNIDAAVKFHIKNAISSDVQRSAGYHHQQQQQGEELGVDAGAGSPRTGSSNESFNALLDSIRQNSAVAGNGKGGERGTRFSHAVEFAQEASLPRAGEEGGVGILAGENRTGTLAPGAETGAAAAAASALAAAVLEAEAAEAAQAAEARRSSKVASTRKALQEKEELERIAELEVLRTEIQQSAEAVESMAATQASLSSRIRAKESELTELLSEIEHLEKDVLIKRKTIEMLPSATDNIAKLQGVCGASSARLLELAQEWEAHRLPLLEQLRTKKAFKAKRRVKCRQMAEEMRAYREEMMSMIQELKEKQDRAQLLADEMSKLPKNINRAIYTHRIMDITASIVKQNKDIDRITNDIRGMQKSINLVSTTLQRTDAIAEELVFEAANQNATDTVMVDTYRRLKTLRSSFEELIGTVNKIGQQETQTRDLETKIDQERSRLSAQNMDRIRDDLRQITEANQQLVQSIKAIASSAAASAAVHK